MKPDQIATMVLNEISDIIYISKIDTYELVYLNRAAKERLGCSKKGQWVGKPCYQILHGRETPCEFCTNEELLAQGECTREHYNEKLECYFYSKIKLITLEGVKARLEMAVDTTDLRKVSVELKKKLLIEETLVQCVRTLHEEADSETAINRLLKIIAEYHQAGRSYIFEIDYEHEIVNNTYEWCEEGIEPQIEYLQKVPLSVIGRWMEQFERQGEFFITSLSGEVEKSSVEYEILETQSIESLLAAPLRVDGQITGFLGVDNPKLNTDTLVLLQSVATFVIDDIQKRKNVVKLYELSYEDRLTGVGNRHAYMEYLRTLEGCKHSLGIVFADINGLKIANDTYGHEYGDKMIKSAARILKSMRWEKIFRIGGDEFVVFCVGVSEKAFEAAVKRLREICEQNRNTTISLGTVWLKESRNVEEKVAQADRLMYMDKQVYYDKCLQEQSDHDKNVPEDLRKLCKKHQVLPAQIRVALPQESGMLQGVQREEFCRELRELGFSVEDE